MTHKTVPWFGVVPVLLLVLGGCTVGGSESSSSAKRTLVYATPSLATTMDPCNNTGGPNSEIINNLYAFWVDYKQVPGPASFPVVDTQEGEKGIIPGTGMMQSWTVSSDQLTWTFRLRQGVKDSFGTPFTADDAKWVFERVRQSTGCSWMADTLNIKDVNQQVKVLDNNTLQIILPAPNAIFLRALNVNNSMALGATARKHTTSSDPWANDWMKQNAPALGPYKLTTWTPGVEMVLDRNPNWYGPKPYFDTVIYRQVPTSSNRVALLLNGQAQVARDLSQDEIDQIAQSKTARADCIAANSFVYAPLDLAQGQPTGNLKVRQALAYAVPYNDIAQSVYRGRAKRLYGFVPAIYSDYLGDAAFPYSTDLGRAKQILAESPYPNGFSTTMLINSSVPEYARIAVLLQNSFKQIGVNLSIDTKPAAAYNDALQNRKFGGTAVYSEHAYILDADYHSLVWFGPGPPPNLNFGGFTHPEFNKIQTQGVAMPDGPARSELMKRMQQIWIDQLPALPLANDPTCFGFSSKVTGYVYRTFDEVIFADLKAA